MTAKTLHHDRWHLAQCNIAKALGPTAAQGRSRLEHLATWGPSAEAFTFARRFDPPESNRAAPS